MSRRQHFLNEDIPYVGNLVFYAPLTNGRNTDLVGSITPQQRGTVTLSSDGAYFSSNSLFTYIIPLDVGKSVRTICMDVMPTSQVNAYDYIYCFGNEISGSAWYRMSILRKSNLYLGGTYSVSGNRYDSDFMTTQTFPNNGSIRLVFVLGETNQTVYYDGTSVKESSYNDSWSGWSFSDVRLYLGGNLNSARYFTGYIKNVRMYDREFSSAEVAAL